MLFLSPKEAYSADWDEYNLTCIDQDGWSDAIDDVITYPADHPCAGCKFKIVYKVRWTSGGTYPEFEILGIFKESGGSNCDACSTYNMVWTLLCHDFFQRNANILIPKMLGNNPIGTPVYTTAYSKAKCFNGQIECQQGFLRCCKRDYEVPYEYDEEHGIFTTSGSLVLVSQTTIPTPCEYPCEVVCDLPVTENDPDNCYECESGYWTLKQCDVPICPTCTLHVNYKYRQNLNCNPSYNDYRIIGYTYDAAACSFCQTDPNNVYNQIVDYLLSSGGITPPPMGDPPQTNWRVIKSLCWHLITGNPCTWEPCNDEACCKTQYQVWTEDDGYGNPIVCKTMLDVTNSNPMVVCQAPDCILWCNAPRRVLTPDHSGKEVTGNANQGFSYAKPNPAQTSFEIHYISEYKGKVILKIYDITGNLVLESTTVKSSAESMMDVNFKDKPSGTYQYQIISEENEILASGKIYVKK